MLTWLAARTRRSEEGFTLIELLVVVAIIALLATFAVPKLFEAINKSKKAPGQADMKTISSALERYYMDNVNSTYPIGASGAAGVTAVKGDLSNGYLKANTSYKNGYGKGYIYVSDAAGSFYVFIDPQTAAAATNLTLSCGSPTAHTATVNAGNGDLNVVQVGSGATDITAADVQAGCTITAGMPAGQTAVIVTN